MARMEFSPEYRGILRLQSQEYGKSVLGAPLRYYPSKGKCRTLFFAAIHGEEPETTFLLSRALRAFDSNFESLAFILCANPDGVTLGTRANANGVDLNRNFPTRNWSPAPVLSRSVLESIRDTILSAGTSAGSEPETKALIALIEKLEPDSIVAMHSPIGCIDAPAETSLVNALKETFFLSHIADIGYPTPGSFGSWCKEQHLECVTLELPRIAPELLFERYGESFAKMLERLDSRT